jgi:hypothetical protein
MEQIWKLLSETPRKDPKCYLNIPNIGSALAWWIFSSKTSHKKDDEKEPKPKETLKIVMLLTRQQNMQNGVERVCYIHLKHHQIKTNIQCNSNNMDCGFTTTPNYCIELMQ